MNMRLAAAALGAFGLLVATRYTSQAALAYIGAEHLPPG
jgi:hypothetical protein